MAGTFSVVTIFPDMVTSYLRFSILKRALEKGIISVRVHNLRDYSTDKHHTVDDYPYGGGAGMVIKPEPFFRLVDHQWPDRDKRRVIMLSPRGTVFRQETAKALSEETREIVFLCGRYEAIDERVRDYLVDDEISIGDYILTGGELPSLVIIDAVSRLLPGVVGDSQSVEYESFASGLLDFPHYTRPEVFRGMEVPKVLLSGNHAEIQRWRKKESLRATIAARPDLLDRYQLSEEERMLLQEIKEETSQ
jgi:tRNA (guanine37-N1)-methyltransferase